ncbi:MAG: transcriptional regulator, partial [Sphingomonas hengshuiensis]
MSSPDFLAKVHSAWTAPPDWIVALAEACQRGSQAAVARRFGVSGSQISHVLANTYPSPTDRLEQLVRGAYLGAVVNCPVLGEIERDRCLEEQAKPFAATSSTRAQLFHA